VQQQVPLCLDFEHGGHLIVAGAPRSGRSTVLRTLAGSIARHVSCRDVHLYVLDCGNAAMLPLADLPHCGAVVTRDQVDRVDDGDVREVVPSSHELLPPVGPACSPVDDVGKMAACPARRRPACGPDGFTKTSWRLGPEGRWAR
jgi:S-DNA-T family DNA segregation ATPase FtsK/SpoIIIE